MRRSWKTIVTAVLAWGGLGTPFAAAQFQPGGYQPPIQQQPAVSPYLNINRFGQPPGLNYYNLVRPQIQTQQQLMNLQNQQQLLASGLAGGGAITPLDKPPPTSGTGHPVNYFDWSRYFPLQGLPIGSAAVGPGAGGIPGVTPTFGNPGLRGTGITPGIGFVVPR